MNTIMGKKSTSSETTATETTETTKTRRAKTNQGAIVHEKRGTIKSIGLSSVKGKSPFLRVFLHGELGENSTGPIINKTLTLADGDVVGGPYSDATMSPAIIATIAECSKRFPHLLDAGFENELKSKLLARGNGQASKRKPKVTTDEAETVAA